MKKTLSVYSIALTCGMLFLIMIPAGCAVVVEPGPTPIVLPPHKTIPVLPEPTDFTPPELVSLVFPQRMLQYSPGDYSEYYIEISIPTTQLNSAKSIVSNGTHYLIVPGISPNEGVAVLTIPREMFDFEMQQDSNTFHVLFADYYFKFYPDLSAITGDTDNGGSSSQSSPQSLFSKIRSSKLSKVSSVNISSFAATRATNTLSASMASLVSQDKVSSSSQTTTGGNFDMASFAASYRSGGTAIASKSFGSNVLAARGIG
jgi:hypothetical protein